MITFADASDASNLVIDKYSYVALYGRDCAYPCPVDISDKWDGEHKRFITQHGDAICSIIDFEQYTKDYADPELLRDWLQARLRDKSRRHAWIYSDLSNAALAAHWARGLPFQWWIATDDQMKRSRTELSALLKEYDVPAEYARVELIAGNQWLNTGSVDESLCYVNANW